MATATTGNLYVPRRAQRNAETAPANSTSTEPETVQQLILNVRLKYPYEALEKFVNKLLEEHQGLPNSVDGRHLSVLQQYALVSTHTTIDMSNQTDRSYYRPDLTIRKNDAFGAWNYNHLLGLLELDYQCADQAKSFPQIWRSTPQTKVQVIKVPYRPSPTTTAAAPSNDEGTLLNLLQRICLKNKCNETDANTWKDALEAENIHTIQHLRAVAAHNDSWDKLSSVRYFVKQMIREHIQLDAPAMSTNTTKDPYAKSMATLFGDIHRLRRYFHYITGILALVPYLDQEAADAAIKEMRKEHDDDGNVLSTIHAYMRTFCLEPMVINPDEHATRRQTWRDDRDRILRGIGPLREQRESLRRSCETAQKEVEIAELGYDNTLRKGPDVQRQRKEIEEGRTGLYTEFLKQRAIGELEAKHERETTEAREELARRRATLASIDQLYAELSTKVANVETQLRDLDAFLQLDLADLHRKLEVKYGRGLLLYGPPGTGKSKLLKCAAAYSGITMITVPLSAGELNRPLVGETEKLLVDIMGRAQTIPYLICAIIIDEIDGLVPKRDGNAQQSKVDGISVLLSHIEGVKDIPNLIVLGATNRRNMMDEAFLRRMQGKCFVGRPSPRIREKMLQSLLFEGPQRITSRHIDFLVRITANFSGAALVALRSTIIVALKQCPSSETITFHTLLTLADMAAREFSCWFGMETLPSIFRAYPNMSSSVDQQKYSLELPQETPPSGRILVNLSDRKCLIELAGDKPSMELPLDKQETSTLTLLSRFISGGASRNIDTIQIIDLNFLTKNNAFEEKQIYELLTTLFLECEEYNRSMLIFDIDALIMLSVSDSAMSKSTSISNVGLYQFIREKCKTAVVEPTQAAAHATVLAQPKEKWVVMIVKNAFLRNLLVEDIDFRKSDTEEQQQRDDEHKRADDESEKMCPKCLQSYIPSKTNHGSCRYHDAFVYDFDTKQHLTREKAQAVMQKAKLDASSSASGAVRLPRLVWACCLGLFAGDAPCRVGSCGLPEELKANPPGPGQDPIKAVEDFFMANQAAKKRIEDFRKM